MTPKTQGGPISPTIFLEKNKNRLIDLGNAKIAREKAGGNAKQISKMVLQYAKIAHEASLKLEIQ